MAIEIDGVMNELDNWVLLRANGKYIPPYSESQSNKISIINADSLATGLLQEDYGIQQVRNEIKKFSEIIISHNYDSIIEIGLGHCGSTHVLWRLLFNKVITIEKSYDRIREFGKNMRLYYNKWVFDDEKSRFLIGYSNDPTVVYNSRKLLPHGIDVLFIDGDHKYESILTDWLLYSPLVKKGGIVAFHDSLVINVSGASQFLNELSNGTIDGKKYIINQIIESNCAGIGYYINE